MRSIWSIVKKNFKLLIRAKSSSLVVILGPMLLIFLVGVAFDNTNVYTLNINVYSDSYSNLTNGFISELEAGSYTIHRSISEEQCVFGIKDGTAHTCIVFPENMEITDNIQNEIEFYVDYSQINLVWNILDTLSTKLDSKSSQISKDLTSVILNQLKDTKETLSDEKASIDNVITNIETIDSDVTKVKADLTALDLTGSSNDFDLDRLERFNAENEMIYESLTSNIQKEINTIKTSISAIEDNANSSAVTTEITKIESDISSIENLIGNNTNMLDITPVLEDLEENVDAVVSKLSSASSSRSASVSKLDSDLQMLSDSKNKLVSSSSSLAEVIAAIDAIKVTSAERISSPITTSIKPVAAQSTNLNYLYPSLIVLVIMFISILLSTTLVLMEKHSPAYFRNLIAPVSSFTFIFATFLTTFIVVIGQTLLILGISIYFFSADLLANIGYISLFLLMITSFFILLGMIVGYSFKSEETSTLAAISLGATLMLISDLILPIESMPVAVQNIAQWNPFVMSEILLKQSIIFNQTFMDQQFLALSFLGYIVVALILVCLAHYLSNKHFLNKLMYRVNKRKLTRKEKKLTKALAKKEAKKSVVKTPSKVEVKTKDKTRISKPSKVQKQNSNRKRVKSKR